MSDFSTKATGVLSTVQKITFKAVQVFNNQSDVVRFAIIRRFLQCFLAPIPFVVSASGTGKFAECRVNRAAQMSGSGQRTHVDGLFQMVQTGFANSGVRINRIGFRRADRDRCGAEFQFSQPGPQFFEVVTVQIEHWQFDSIESDCLKLLEHGEVLLSNLRIPEQQVHSIFHGSILQECFLILLWQMFLASQQKHE